MKNRTKAIISILLLLMASMFVALIFYIQNNRMAFTGPHLNYDIDAVKFNSSFNADLAMVSTNGVSHVAPTRKTYTANYIAQRKTEKPCVNRWRVIGFSDDKFESFRGVWSCEPTEMIGEE